MFRLLAVLVLLAACKEQKPAPVPTAATPAAPTLTPAVTAPASPGALTDDELASFTKSMCDELTFDAKLMGDAMELSRRAAGDLPTIQKGIAEATRLRAEFLASHPISARMKSFTQLTESLFEVVVRGRRVKAHKPDGLAGARAHFGAALTDSVLAREDEILEKLNRCAAEKLGTTSAHASPAAPSEFSRAAGIKLGMSEAEVAQTLKGTQTERRPLGTLVDVGYNLSATEGAIARFSGDALESIEFVRSPEPGIAGVSRAVSDAVANGPLAIKAINYVMSKKDPLTLDEVVSKTGGAGQRLRWRLFAAADGTPQASTTFAWRVEQQSNVLLAVETAGVVEQPVVRPVSR